MYKNLSMAALGHTVSFDEAVELAKKHDFSGIELDLGYLAALGPEGASDLLGIAGLRPGGFWLRAAWRETDSESEFVESLRLVEADVELAAALDCKRCLTRVEPRSERLDFYQHFDLVVPRLIRVAEMLAPHGIMLGFEFAGPSTLRTSGHKDFVHTLDGARTFAASIGMHSLNTGVLVDSFHWYTSGGSLNEIEHLDHQEVVSVYLNDAVATRSIDAQLDHERELVGSTGVIDISGLLAALRTIGYLGPLTVAPFNSAIQAMSPDAAVGAASAALDRVLVASGLLPD